MSSPKQAFGAAAALAQTAQPETSSQTSDLVSAPEVGMPPGESEREARVHSFEDELRQLPQDPNQGMAKQGTKISSLLELLLTVVGGCVLLALLVAEGTSAKWAIFAILAGLAAATLLIHDAQTVRRKTIPKVLLYSAGFILLAEVVLFIDRLVSRVSR